MNYPPADKVFVTGAGLEGASVVVTGASGFIGGHVIRRLAGKCRRLVAVARGTTTLLHPHLRDVELRLADVSVTKQIQEVIAQADVVIHLAGHSGASDSMEDPAFDLQANVGGMIAILEAARRSGRPCRIVFPGSRLEYGASPSLPVNEDAPMHPMSPYGLHKHACELYLDLYSRLYGISYAVARLTNPYGPWLVPPTREYNVLNKMVAAAQRGETLTVYGDGGQLRDYVYIDDVVDALELLAQRTDNVIANVGSGQGIRFRDAAEAIVRAAGRGSLATAPWPEHVARVETGDFVADISRMSSLGWRPKTGFESGVRATLRASLEGQRS